MLAIEEHKKNVERLAQLLERIYSFTAACTDFRFCIEHNRQLSNCAKSRDYMDWVPYPACSIVRSCLAFLGLHRVFVFKILQYVQEIDYLGEYRKVNLIHESSQLRRVVGKAVDGVDDSEVFEKGYS